ncbi:MAG: hypothetical protein ABIA63_11495, partial [bacterium]
DKKIIIGYLRDGINKECQIYIRRAPKDFQSAEKYANKYLGLTVKDITYEVRDALKIPYKSPGIIVSKIEPGSPAAIGRIGLFEVIEAVDGKVIKNTGSFEKLITRAFAREKRSVKLTVRDLDKTRFIDLELNREISPQNK